ncbi:hypothetical protein F4821DRAFT_260071 [Hypoxylon rubiginosum]|uniref:Uncharacterized protein n=1 Tax=Hypoxylon rubiginosum TaxID=110542 RepID=A0ACC0D205_9PEZI|nr:hypothetical protein F4821DRAFT_260071 [Hypoxylon rubiginosum]
MPGRKGYDMTSVARSDRQQKSEKIQQDPSDSSTTNADLHIDHLEAPPRLHVETPPIQDPQEASDQPFLVSPGYTKTTDGQHTVFNPRGWLRSSKSFDSFLPRPAKQNTTTTDPILDRIHAILNDSGHADRIAIPKRPGFRRSMSSIPQRAIRRASQAASNARRVISQTKGYGGHQLRQLPGLMHSNATVAPVTSTGNTRDETRYDTGFCTVPAIIVTEASDDEGDDDGFSRVIHRIMDEHYQTRYSYSTAY